MQLAGLRCGLQQPQVASADDQSLELCQPCKEAAQMQQAGPKLLVLQQHRTGLSAAAVPPQPVLSKPSDQGRVTHPARAQLTPDVPVEVHCPVKEVATEQGHQQQKQLLCQHLPIPALPLSHTLKSSASWGAFSKACLSKR